MARFLIPNYKMPQLQKKIQHIRNKGADVTFDVIDPNVNIDIDNDRNHLTLNCSEVEVSGEYRLNGWNFVGTIQHGDPQNIIRLADYSFENRIPERYRTAPKECEHCHIRRDRNDTYLVYNEDADEFRQVGRTCLRGYTNGLNAETCAELVSIVAELAQLNSETRNHDFDDEEIRALMRSGAIRPPMHTVRKQAYRYVEQNGYTPGETGRQFCTALDDNPQLPQCTDEQAQAVEDWLRSEVDRSPNGYNQNALAAWTKPQFEPRDAGLITSAVSVYLRDQQRQIARQQQELARQQRLASAENDYAGNVGDKVTLTIASVQVAYYRSSNYGYRESSYPVYRIVGQDGKVYLWGCTTGQDLEEGDVLTGTIKRLNERPNGEKQTELTRCKVTDAAANHRYRGFNFGN